MLWEMSSDSEEMSTSHSRLPWFITQIVFMIGASSSCRRKHRLADYKSALAWLQRCRSLWMYFFLLFLQHHSCLTPQTDIFRSFHMAVSRFKAFCLRALQTFAVSDHIRWFEVWSYCSPPPVCHCENVPLSRLLEVILGKFSVQEISNRGSSSWLKRWITTFQVKATSCCQKCHRMGVRVVSHTHY